MVPGAENRKVSIIVVNWNGESLLEQCLEALFRQTYSDYEVIVVDNGSKDSSVSLVRSRFPESKIVELPSNAGFSGGNWAGLAVAQGEFIALVNNDARPDEQWLQNLIQPMFQDSRIGFCSSKILIAGTNNINSAGGGITTSGVGYDRGLGEPMECYDSAELVFGACAAAGLYRRKMLEEIGFLDKDFFLYAEDTDLSFRAQLAGWKCRYVPTALVYHRFHATSGLLSDVHVYHHVRNLEFVWIKNMPGRLMLKFAHHKLIEEIGDFRSYCIRRGRWGAFFRAKRDALRMLPGMIRKRKEVQKTKRVSDADIEKLLAPIFGETMRRHRHYSSFVVRERTASLKSLES